MGGGVLRTRGSRACRGWGVMTGKKGWEPLARPLVSDEVSEGRSLEPLPTRTSLEARSSQQPTPNTSSCRKRWAEVAIMTPGAAVPLEPDPKYDPKTKFPEAPTSWQPEFLNQRAPEYSAPGRVKGLRAHASLPSFSQRPGAGGGKGPVAPGAPRSLQSRAPPAARAGCSARLCPTGTSTAPRSARHPPARRRRRPLAQLTLPSPSCSPAKPV